MIAAYIRVSTKEQADSGLGLDAQRAAIAAYCVSNFPDQQLSWIEEHASAKDINGRPRLRALLDNLDGTSDLVVLRLDRLARNTRDLLNLCALLDDRKIHLHSVREKVDTRTPTGKLFLTLLGGFAQFERDIIAQRTSDAIHEKIKRGGRWGRIPFGFTTNDLTPDPQEIQTVRNIYLLHKVGLGRRLIAKLSHTTPGIVRWVLKNPIYRARGIL